MVIQDIDYELKLLDAQIERIPHELPKSDWWTEIRKIYKPLSFVHAFLYGLGFIKLKELNKFREVKEEYEIVHTWGTLLVVRIGNSWFKTLGVHEGDAELTFWFNFLTSPRFEDIHDWKKPSKRRKFYSFKPQKAQWKETKEAYKTNM